MLNTTSILQKRKTPEGQLLLIELSVFVTFVLMVFVFVAGIVRRRYRSTFLKALSSGAYVAITLLIPYILGLMQNLYRSNQLISIWAVLLVYVYCLLQKAFYSNNGPTMGETCTKIFTYWMYVGLMYPTKYQLSYETPFFLLLLIASIVYINDIIHIHRLLKPHVSRLVWRRSSGRQEFNGLEFQEDLSPDVIRDLDEEGCILSNAKDPSHHLRTKLFSIPLFFRLLDKIRGVPSFRRSSYEDSRSWLLDPLLDPTSSERRCPFRLIEAELTLLYDLLYEKTGSTLFRTNGIALIAVLVQQLVFALGIFWLVLTFFKFYDHKKQTSRIQYHKFEVDLLLTWIVITATIMLHLLHFIKCFNSWWISVSLLYIYVIQRSWRNATVFDGCIKTLTEGSLRRAHHELFKPWQRKLGQYSLLDSYSFMQDCHPLAYIINLFSGNRFFKVGRKETESVNLSQALKNAINERLEKLRPQLTNGIVTLEKSTLPELTWACKLQTDAEVILVWHIATTMCEIKPGGQHSNADRNTDHFQVATTLSKYCAYLVAFAPDLLPGNPPTTENICSLAVEDANVILKDCQSSEIYDKLLHIADKDSSVLKQGALLGKVLSSEVPDIEMNTNEMWKLLADFWVEMILYLAPNMYNDFAHLDRLKDGGEFITHLWALLFHIGIIDRDSLDNVPNMASVDNPPATTSST